MQSKPRIVIIGGGAGGIELAIRLAQSTRRGRDAEVILVDRRPTHLWKPRLHEIAVGLLVASEDETSFAAQAAHHGFEFVLGEMTAFDPAQRLVEIAAVKCPSDLVDAATIGELLPQRTLHYDLAVLAIGSTVNDFGTPGVSEHCYTLDSPEQAQRLNRAFLSFAMLQRQDASARIRVAIVGAGTTGVELASELRNAAQRLVGYRSLQDHRQVQIEIIEMANRPLPGADRRVSNVAQSILRQHEIDTHFGAKVERISAGMVHLADGNSLPADIIVWASGVRGHRIVSFIPGLQPGRDGRVRVDDMLRAIDRDGSPIPGLYCIGDCAAYREKGSDTPIAATAQAAHQQAVLLARSLAGQLAGKQPLRFRYRYRGTVVSLGHAKATGTMPAMPIAKSVAIHGIAAKAVYTSLYRMHLTILFGWWRMIALTLSGMLRRSASPSVKLDWH